MSGSESLWVATAGSSAYPALDADQRFDVAVVGAGIAGTTTALLLKREGLRVALLDMGLVGHGVTGHTTAKVTSLHQLVYAELTSKFDAETARLYAEANEAGLRRIGELVEELGIDCAFERRPALTYTADPEQESVVSDEVDAARDAGLPVSLVRETDLPFDVVAAVRLDDQAQLHPIDYVLGLAGAIDGDGSAVFERSRVIDVRAGRVETVEGAITAEHVVVATQLPIVDRGLFFAKAHPSRSYALAAPTNGPLPDGMFITAEQPTRSVRPYERDGQRMLVVSGDDPDGIESWVREHFDVDEVAYRWSAHDYAPVDKLPYVGQVARTLPRVWTATGFRKWGFTNATMAAMIITDLVQGRDNPWASTFDAHRLTPAQSAASFVSENIDVARHFVGDRLGLPGREALEDLAAGQGLVVRIGGEAYAVSRDESGELRSVSPVCTHMGCHVSWNSAERTWDCPCHGSRFQPDGTLVQGPAVRDLDAKDLPD